MSFNVIGLQRACKAYLSTCLILLLMGGCLPLTLETHESSLFERAERENTFLAYEQYLVVYPDGTYANEARETIRELAKQKFGSAKTVRVVVSESYPNWLEGVTLPFEDVARRLLTHSGLEVVEDDRNDAELSLSIKAEGRPIRAGYYGGGQRWSGASVEGTIGLETREGSYEQPFSGAFYPPNQLIGSHSNPSDAPFLAALIAGGSFTQKIGELAGSLYGLNALKEAREDDEWLVRIAAVSGIAAMVDQTDAAVPLLIVALSDENTPHVFPGQPSYGGFRDLNKARFPVAEVALRALVNTNNPLAIEALVGSIEKGESHPRARWWAVIAPWKELSTLNPRIADVLIAGVLAPSPFKASANTSISSQNIDQSRRVGARIYGIKRLNRLGDPRVVAVLASLLDDDTREVRSEALKALGESKDPQAVERLIALLERDERSFPAEKVLKELRKFDNPRAVEYLRTRER